MKYSIQIEQSKQHPFPLFQQSTTTKTFPHYQQTNFVQILNNNLRFINITNQSKLSIDEIPQQKTNTILEIMLKEQLNWQKLKQIWRGDQYWLLVFQEPVCLYFALRKYQKIQKIKLEEELMLVQTSVFVSYPDVFVYGHKTQTFTNHLYSINLFTFETKNLTPNKEYNPGNRKDYWAYFSDHRLYVYGGKDSQGKQLEQLFWTFNIENGNWFALDMPSIIPFNNSGPFCEIQSGKVLQLTPSNQLLLIQLYQSRVSIVQGIQKLQQRPQFSKINGLFTYKQRIYFNDSQIKPYRIQITKSKIPK